MHHLKIELDISVARRCEKAAIAAGMSLEEWLTWCIRDALEKVREV